MMLKGWILLVVLTNGMNPSTTAVFSNFATETDCRQAAAQSVSPKDRWICFKGKI